MLGQVATPHVLIALNLILFGLALVLMIYTSRKRVVPMDSTYYVEGEYRPPCDPFYEFAKSWKDRWSSKLPQYHEVFTYANRDSYIIKHLNTSRSTFTEVHRDTEKEVGLQQYFDHIENAMKISCFEDNTGSRLEIMTKFFHPEEDSQDMKGKNGKKHDEATSYPNHLVPLCNFCDTPFRLSYTHLNALQKHLNPTSKWKEP